MKILRALAALAFLLIPSLAKAQLTTLYLAATAAGNSSGSSCANAKVYTFFNSSANWGNGTSQIGPGTTVHVCGTISLANNGPALSFQGSGASGKPITLLFEAGTVITTSSYWGPNGAINLGSNSWIAVDGQGSGTIQSTGNGSSLANQGAGNGLSGGNVSNAFVQNLTIANMYVYVSPDENANIQSTGGISISSGTNLTIQGNTIHDAPAGIYFQGSSGSNITIRNNTITNFNWGIACAACNVTNLLVTANSLSGTSYNDPSDFFHHNGFIMFPQPGNTCTNCVISNNRMNNVGGHTTAHIFIDPTSPGDAPGIQIYNNVLSGGNPANAYITVGIGISSSLVANNTISGTGAQGISGQLRPTIKNNIVTLPNVGIFLNSSYVGPVSDYNDFFALAGSGGIVMVAGGSNYTSVPLWVAGTGLDVHSITTNPNLSAALLLNSGSPAIGTGTNLTSLGIAGLDVGAPQTFGVGGSCGTGCRARSPSTPWDMGAYPFQSSGGPPVVSFSPTSLAFGTILVGSTSPVKPVTLSNTGGSALTISSIALTGTNPTDFAQTNNCGAGINAGGSCTINVTCTPLSGASFSANVSVTDNAAGSPHTVPLTCTGSTATPTIAFSPTSIAFAARTVGTVSSATPVTVTNNGSGTLTITNIAIAGANPTSFSQTNNCSSVASGGGTCTIQVTFRPQIAGALAANVSVTDNAAGSPQTVPLTGTGNGSPAISFNPTNLAFGNEAVSSTTAALSTTVTNTGTAALVISAVALTGTNAADFAISADTCVTTLAVNGTCSASVTFTPSATGARTAALSFTDNATGSPQAVALTGTGTQAGAGFSPTSFAFGSQAVATTSAPQTTTLTNTGSATLNISSITVTGTNASDFTISGKTCGATLAASGTCTVSATFTPSIQGAESASLSFADNAPASPQTVPMTGTGTSTSLTVTPSSLAFPITSVGTSAPTQVVRLANVGNSTIAITSTVISGTNAADFSQTNNCPTVLATVGNTGSTCTVTVTFKPTASGARTANLVLTNGAPTSPQTVVLNGTGAQSGATLSPISVTFPATPIGNTSSAINVTLTNDGTATLNIASVALGGTNPSYFAISSNGCGATLGAGLNCVVALTFTPQAAISAAAVLSVTDDAPGSPQQVGLFGLGTFLSVSLNPTTLTFPNTAVSSPSAPLTVTMTNNGNGVLAISAVSITGTNAADYSQTNNCGSSLAGGGSCTFKIVFTPGSTGSRTATLSVTDSGPTSPDTVSLSGTGFTPAPAVTLSVSSVTFGNQTTGTASNPQVVILTNTGTGSLTITSTSITGTNSGDFGKSTTCGGSLAVNASCTYSLTFTPTAAGSRSATFNLVTNAASSPNTVSLAGTGVTSPGGAPAPQVFGD